MYSSRQAEEPLCWIYYAILKYVQQFLDMS